MEDDIGSVVLVWIIHILSSNFFLQPFLLLSLPVAIACNIHHDYEGEDASDDNADNSKDIGGLTVVVIAVVGIVGTISREIAAVVVAALVVAV